MQRRILCLHLPNWPIQRVLAGHKKDEGRRTKDEPAKDEPADFVLCPSSLVLLHARDPRRGQLVVAASDAALARGIRPGMPLAEVAGTLRVPSSGNSTRSVPITLPHDPAADLAELARLAEHCERFSPLVGWETAEAQVQGSKFKVQGSGSQTEVGGRNSSTLNFEPGTLNSLFFDVTGIGPLFGGEERLAAEVVADMARLGYTAHVAVADTIGAAWAAAQMRNVECGMRNGDSEKSPAILSSLRTPNSAFRTFLLESLRLPAETLDLLAQLGLKHVGDVLALPRASLRVRFGERLLLRLDQLTGAAQEMIIPYRPPPKFAAEWILEYPAEQRDVIEQILRELISRVATQLAERREGVVQLRCRLDCVAGLQPATSQSGPFSGRLKTCPTRIDVGLFRPSADARHLGDLVRMQLAQMRLPGAVGRVTVQALVTAPLENRQGQLFAGGRDEADRQLALLIDRLSSRLGPDAVLRPQLTADPLPERAVRSARMRNTECGMRNKKRAQGSGFRVQGRTALHSAVRTPHSALERPLFLREPLPLDAVSVVPEGPPIAFRFQGREHRVAAHWGPERIETGWFRGQSVRRDYYRVETTAGLRFWLFRRLEDGRWHLHGEFS